jgi:choline dehydrogenase-like flavoprotein
MNITNLEDHPHGTALTSDICIVGAGPAGLTIATELAQTALRVLVIESGADRRETSFAASLNGIESVGEPLEMNTRKVRNRVLGGSSHTWSGRCTPLDAIDYEERWWIPGSGWPITGEEMSPYLRRAGKYLGLDAMEYDDSLLGPLGLSSQLHDRWYGELQSVFWQFSCSSSTSGDFMRFGPRFKKLRSENVSVVTNATVTQLLLDESGGRVHELEIAEPSGKKHKVRCGYVVLCTGAIENARLLLASNRQQKEGVGNQNDMVGRCLMDHPRTTVGTFPRSAHKALQQELGLFSHAAGSTVQRGLSPTADVQRKLGLLNCAAWTTQHVDDDDAWRALRSMARNNGTDKLTLGKIVLRHGDQIAAGLWAKMHGGAVPRRLGRVDLDMMSEQLPSLTSRVMLSQQVDALGMPRAQVDWRIGTMEREAAIYLGHAVNEYLAHAGMPTAELRDWVRERRPEDAVFCDSAHPSGTTRMAEDEASGVVDETAKVHGLENLYIAGASVFPTAGHANPTMMIVALALRLADKLRKLETRIVIQQDQGAGRVEQASAGSVSPLSTVDAKVA